MASPLKQRMIECAVRAARSKVESENEHGKRTVTIPMHQPKNGAPEVKNAPTTAHPNEKLPVGKAPLNSEAPAFIDPELADFDLSQIPPRFHQNRPYWRAGDHLDEFLAFIAVLSGSRALGKLKVERWRYVISVTFWSPLACARDRGSTATARLNIIDLSAWNEEDNGK